MNNTLAPCTGLYGQVVLVVNFIFEGRGFDPRQVGGDPSLEQSNLHVFPYPGA